MIIIIIIIIIMVIINMTVEVFKRTKWWEGYEIKCMSKHK